MEKAERLKNEGNALFAKQVGLLLLLFSSSKVVYQSG